MSLLRIEARSDDYAWNAVAIGFTSGISEPALNAKARWRKPARRNSGRDKVVADASSLAGKALRPKHIGWNNRSGNETDSDNDKNTNIQFTLLIIRNNYVKYQKLGDDRRGIYHATDLASRIRLINYAKKA